MTDTLLTLPVEAADVDGPLVCTAVRRVTHDVVDLTLEAAVPTRFAFEPGQHLTVTVPVGGERLSRCYSVSSSAARPQALTLTVKRVPGGPVSGWLHDTLRPGDLLEVSGPAGSFTPLDHPDAPQLHLTAGSGITPLMSAVRTLADHGRDADVVLVHLARTPADIPWRDELAGLSDRHPGLRVAVVCEDDSATERWTGPRGRITSALLAELVPDAHRRRTFLCGPAPFMAAARVCLAEVGVDPSLVHEESYVLAGTSSETPAAAEPGAATYSVELRRSGRTIACPAGVPLLDAVLEAGVAQASSCREGVCGTCKTAMLSGAVEMHHQGGIRQREIDRGQVLLCCSTPTEDVVLDA